MKWEIQFDGGKYIFLKKDLPMLISYAEKTGGSQFSVELIADMFSQGAKIIFLTAYPMATEQFLSEIPEAKKGSCEIVDSLELFREKKLAEAILVTSGNQDLFLEILENFEDLDDRVVFIKNIETFSDQLVSRCLLLDNCILSGDIDESSSKEMLAAHTFQTTILFSQPKIQFPLHMPNVPKYQGYMWSGNSDGIVRVVEEK